MHSNEVGLICDTEILNSSNTSDACTVSIVITCRIASRRIEIGRHASEGHMLRIDSSIDDVDIDSQSQSVRGVEPISVIEAVRIAIHGVETGNAPKPSRSIYSPYGHPGLSYSYQLDQDIWINLENLVHIVFMKRSGEALEVWWSAVDCVGWEFRDGILDVGARVEQSNILVPGWFG